MKLIMIYLLCAGVLFLSSCGGGENMTNEEKISGKESKTWNATRELNPEGEKDKLSRQEKKESITFSRNGTVKMSNNDQVMSGNWSYSDNTLTLQFTGASVTENFTVIELQKDKMRLLAADGSQMTLEPD